jgi:hypothetical protein
VFFYLLKKVMPNVIQPATQHHSLPGERHYLLYLRQLWLGITVGAAMFTTRFFGFQRTFQAPGQGIFQK